MSKQDKTPFLLADLHDQSQADMQSLSFYHQLAVLENFLDLYPPQLPASETQQDIRAISYADVIIMQSYTTEQVRQLLNNPWTVV